MRPSSPSGIENPSNTGQAGATRHALSRALVAAEKILQGAADEFEVIGTTATPKVLGVLNKRLMNVNEKMPWAWPFATPAGSLPQQWSYR